ncbi:MAG: tyrosine-type recombinase/integrase [Muribaculaceae bacterium]|nr:tyrosine-type recombinase/integrase [Muribaculaceae bacterium]
MSLIEKIMSRHTTPLTEAFRMKYPGLMFILEYFRIANGVPAYWHYITKPRLQRFVDYLSDNFAPNTVNQYCTRLKVILNTYADEVQLPKDYAKILSPRKVPSTEIYLTEEELQRLQNYQPKSKNELFVRNTFLIGAYSGARHVDILHLNESNIRGNKLVFVAQKTKKEAVLPLKPIVADYIRNTPKVEISDIAYNNSIRRICRKVGIIEKVKIFKAGKEVELDKCDAVSSHTARRSFATCLHLRGVDIYTISKMLQHSDVKLTSKYIGAGVRDLTEQEMEFFK